MSGFILLELPPSQYVQCRLRQINLDFQSVIKIRQRVSGKLVNNSVKSDLFILRNSLFRVEYVALALNHKPKVNLGQGFPDYAPPSYVTKALSDVANGNHLMNQYTRGFGHPRLVQAIAKLYSQFIGREINPNTEVLVTVGAYQSLYSAITGHVDDGDEVIIIEPFYDCYYDQIKSAGGVVRSIALKPSKSGIISSADWKLDPAEFEKLFNNKTKALILNTPHNPLGKGSGAAKSLHDL